MRPDNPEAMQKHTGLYSGGTALIVLGGPSGASWEALRDEVRPDVILIGNGVNSMVRDADYWMCAENMTTWTGTNRMAKADPVRSAELMEMFYREAGAKVKLISHRSWHLLKDTTNCISIRRTGFDFEDIPAGFSFRKYGEGFLSGGISKHPETWQRGVKVRYGTIAIHLLHLAGILGCTGVHTIGLDLCFKDGHRHHAYDYPAYQVDPFRTSEMFTDYKGLKTQWIWLETAEFLGKLQPLFVYDGIYWQDHSGGLLEMEGIAQ